MLFYAEWCSVLLNLSQNGHIKMQGTNLSQSLFPASCLCGCDDCIQKFQLLARGAFQRFQPLVYGCCMNIGHPPCQFFFSCFCFGVIHDQIDRCHFPDNGYLPGQCPSNFEYDCVKSYQTWIKTRIYLQVPGTALLELIDLSHPCI